MRVFAQCNCEVGLVTLHEILSVWSFCWNSFVALEFSSSQTSSHSSQRHLVRAGEEQQLSFLMEALLPGIMWRRRHVVHLWNTEYSAQVKVTPRAAKVLVRSRVSSVCALVKMWESSVRRTWKEGAPRFPEEPIRCSNDCCYSVLVPSEKPRRKASLPSSATLRYSHPKPDPQLTMRDWEWPVVKSCVWSRRTLTQHKVSSTSLLQNPHESIKLIMVKW